MIINVVDHVITTYKRTKGYVESLQVVGQCAGIIDGSFLLICLCDFIFLATGHGRSSYFFDLVGNLDSNNWPFGGT